MISKRTLLGSLPGGHEVYRIDRVAVLTLSSSESPEFELDVSFETHSHIYIYTTIVFLSLLVSKFKYTPVMYI